MCTAFDHETGCDRVAVEHDSEIVVATSGRDSTAHQPVRSQQVLPMLATAAGSGAAVATPMSDDLLLRTQSGNS